MSGFTCPKCGGCEFGSSCDAAGVWTRHCHGYDGCGGCRFEWPETDDAQYGLTCLQRAELGVLVGAIGDVS